MSSSLNSTPEWDINNFYIRPEKIKDKRYVHIYPCCVQEKLGEVMLAEDFEKILDKDFGFEEFINSYFKYSCINPKNKMLKVCKLPSQYSKEGIKKFFGINNCLFIPCNLSCNFCRWKDERLGFTKEDIEYYKKLYFKLLDKWADSDFEYLRLTEYGEPLLPIEDNIKFFEKVKKKKTIEIIKKGDIKLFEKVKKKKTIAITTNGILLDKYVPIFERFKDNIDFKVSVSLNAYDREVYKYKMNSNSFDKVIENMYLAKDFIRKITFFIDDKEKDNESYFNFLKAILPSFKKDINVAFIHDLRNPKNLRFTES